MSETDPQHIFRLPLSGLSEMTLLSPSSPPTFDPFISFPTHSPKCSLHSTGSQALGFPAGLGRAGVLKVEWYNTLASYVTVTKHEPERLRKKDFF